ncbi:MAG: hypothetical protein ACR2RV_19905 [Verrucomicrobiales bacterium]
METKTADLEPDQAEPIAVPTVTAKRPPAEAAPRAVSEDEQSAAEIARLSSWATGECGDPILPD